MRWGRGGSEVPRQLYAVWTGWSGLKFGSPISLKPSNIAENITQHLWSALSPGLHKTLANLFFLFPLNYVLLCLPLSLSVNGLVLYIAGQSKKHQNTTPTLSLVNSVAEGTKPFLD